MRRILLATAACLALAAPAAAAVTANSVVTAQTPNVGVQNFVQGTDGTGTDKTLYTAGTNGSKCWAVIESNTDTTATHLVTVAVKRSSTDYQISSVTTGLGDANVTGLPAKNLIAASVAPLPTDSDVNPYLLLNSGDTLVAQYATALTSSTRINVVSLCADF